VARIGLAAPALHEPLDDGGGLVDLLLRHGRQTQATGRLGDEGQRGHRHPGQVLAGLLVGDVQQLAETPVGGQHGDSGLHVHPDVAGVHRHRERLGGRQTRPELPVDQQRPDVAEGDLADQILDVHTAISQCAAFLVRFGDLTFEGDHTFEAWLEVGHLALLDLSPRSGAPLLRWDGWRWRPSFGCYLACPVNVRSTQALATGFQTPLPGGSS
jgi:hypothetical protein